MSSADFEYLGPYHVERVLGRGGMGSVYKGIHAQSGHVVAVKVIATGIANQPRFRRRFAAEVEALKRLKHPNVVELIGYGEEKGLLFYAMEYVEGRSLHEVLRQREKLTWQEVVQYAIETTAALKHAHNIGIIHRDLKPANLMLSSSGQIKLTDFGISKLFGSSDETAAGSVIGTADYMPPEQAEGKPVNVRSDLYSLGCVMYALLTGKAPFGGKSVPEVLYAVRYNPVPNLATRADDLPDELVALVHQLLEKDPQKRPPTALVVGNRLKALQKGMQRKTSLDERVESKDSPDSSTQEHIGTELTSLDLSEVEDDDIRLTGAEQEELQVEADSGETRRGDGLGTHEQATILAPKSDGAPKTVSGYDATLNLEDAGQTGFSSHLSAVEPSPGSSRGLHNRKSGELSGEFRSFASDEEPITSGGPSHFTPVEDARDTGFGFSNEELVKEPTIDWIQIGSMIGIVALLITAVAFGWWMLLPPSADELYASITTASDSGDDGQLLAASTEIESFLQRFPDDERHIEIAALNDEAELVRRAKLLQRKAARGGGIDELTAIEQAFLDCLQARSENATLAKQKLDAFLTVFGQLENLNHNDARLVELAEFAAQAGRELVVGKDSPAKLQLEKLIQAADKSLSGQALQSYYRNLLLLYQDKPWAAEQITRIKRKIDEA
ncbi:MAG: serine/threonine-protein kinase [Pirellulaceae bacterium]